LTSQTFAENNVKADGDAVVNPVTVHFVFKKDGML